mmetsp:Transcript_41826/g.82045  ORF Transcript_41826/g.82045 Transcript_41826/m.82045 type:complete len:237 (-) Transcript_41826:6376-7086(-)
MILGRKHFPQFFVHGDHSASNFTDIPIGLLGSIQHLGSERKHGFDVRCVNAFKLIVVWIRHVHNVYCRRKTCRQHRAPNTSSRVHRSNDLDIFDRNPVQIVVMKPFVAHELLQKSDQLNCVVNISFRQVQVLEKKNEAIPLFWSKNSPFVSCELRAHGHQFLNDVFCLCLGRAVNGRYRSGLQVLEHRTKQQSFSTTFRAHQNKRFHIFQPGLNDSSITLHINSVDYRRRRNRQTI